jgi:hypothetical protein
VAYRLALRQLVPDWEGIGCICITEQGPPQPGRVQTLLDPPGALNGQKRWASLLGPDQRLLVLAALPGEGPRKELRMVVVRRGAPGLRVEPMPPTPFLPELAHQRLIFEGCPVEAVLPGAGWDTYARPFRGLEDRLVGAAALGQQLRLRRQLGQGPAQLAPLLALGAGLLSLEGAPVEEPGVVLLQAQLLGQVAALEAPQGLPEELALAWARDRLALELAGAARQARLDKALMELGRG